MIRRIVKKYRELSFYQRAWIQRLFFPVFAVSRFRRECRFDIYRMDGDREMWYCTSHEISPYIMKEFFPGSNAVHAGRIAAWNLPSFVRGHHAVIVDMDRFFSFLFPGAMFTFPWIQQVLDLDIPLSDILKHIRERKQFSQYGCEISSDPVERRFFYDEMYVPFVRERFADQAVIPELDRIEYLFPGTEVLFVTEEGRRIGGSVGMLDGDTYRWLYTAIADERHRKNGALSCAYYFGILRAKELGARRIDLGLSRPFLSDGVVLHKRKWRATFRLEEQTRRWFLVSNLEKEHLIVLIDGTLTALVASPEDPSVRHFSESGVAFRVMAPKQESTGNSGNNIG